MAKDHRQPQRRRGLDRKQKAQIAVAVITTLPQLIWAIAFLLSTLMGKLRLSRKPGSRTAATVRLPPLCHAESIPVKDTGFDTLQRRVSLRSTSEASSRR